MSEAIIPDVEITSDVPEKKTLAELVRMFEELAQSEDRMKLFKEAEAVKAAFYKRLAKEKAEAGITAAPVTDQEEGADVPEVSESTADNPFTEIEKGFTHHKRQSRYYEVLERGVPYDSTVRTQQDKAHNERRQIEQRTQQQPAPVVDKRPYIVVYGICQYSCHQHNDTVEQKNVPVRIFVL